MARFLQVILGVVLFLAGVGKIFEPPYFLAETIVQYRLLGRDPSIAVAMFLPLFEALLGFFLMAGLWRRTSSWAAVGLFAIFLAAMLSVKARGLEISDCGCIPGRHEGGLRGLDVARTGGLLVVALAAGWRQGAPRLSALRECLKPARLFSARQLLMAAAVALPLVSIGLERIHGQYRSRAKVALAQIEAADIALFYSPYCGRCRSASRLLASAVAETPEVRVAWINIFALDAERARRELDERFGIAKEKRAGFPAVFTAQGALVADFEREELEAAVEAAQTRAAAKRGAGGEGRGVDAAGREERGAR